MQSKPNAAQSILYALGVFFPLYSENKTPRKASYTKKGPGRRHHTTPAERMLRDVMRGKLRTVGTVLQNHLVTRVSTGWLAPRRGAYSLVIRSGKLYMRGFRFDVGMRRVVIPEQYA